MRLLLDFYVLSIYFDLHIQASWNKVFLVVQLRIPWMFVPLDIFFEYWIKHVAPSEFFISCLDSLLGYSVFRYLFTYILM